MEIFSLSGPSGTGKSTSALSFAYEKKIPAIIDDGLLIINGQRVAGTSAKFEKNAVTAVKRATFFDQEHILEVQQALKNFFVSRLLIIGTSDKMVHLIAKRLQLGEIKHHYYVQDIRTSSEIKLAQFIRKTEGKHVIPIPYKQVEQNFFKKFIQKGMEIFSHKKIRIGETTIVHPDFHRGSIHISEKVFKKIAEKICLEHEAIAECVSSNLTLIDKPSLNIVVKIKLPIKKMNLIAQMEDVQAKLYEGFTNYVNIELESINITVLFKQ